MLLRHEHPFCTGTLFSLVHKLPPTLLPMLAPCPPSCTEAAPPLLPPLQIYNRRLDERERRRQFVLDRGLLNIKRQQVGLLVIHAYSPNA